RSALLRSPRASSTALANSPCLPSGRLRPSESQRRTLATGRSACRAAYSIEQPALTASNTIVCSAAIAGSPASDQVVVSARIFGEPYSDIDEARAAAERLAESKG